MTTEVTVLDVIKDKVKNTDVSVRREAADDLVYVEEQDAEELLLELILDENKGVREAAGEALLRRGNQSGAARLVKNFGNPRIEVRNQAVLLLTEMGEPVLEHVLPALNDPDRDVRKFAADVLGDVKSPAAVSYLVKAIHDKDPNVGFSAVEALGKIGGDEAFNELEEAFRDNADVRSTVAETLGKIGNPEGVRVIEKGLHDEDPIVVFASTEAFGLIGGANELKLLESLIQESDGYIKGVAIASLIKILIRTNSESNIDLLSDENVIELCSAVEGNREISEFIEGYIVQAVMNDYAGGTFGYYSKLCNELKVVVLNSLTNKKNDLSVELVISALKETNTHIKMAAISIFYNWEDEDLVKYLIELLDDEDDWVCYRAAEAIGIIGGEGSIKALLSKVESDIPLRQIAILKALESLAAKDELLRLTVSEFITDGGVKETLNEIIGRIENA